MIYALSIRISSSARWIHAYFRTNQTENSSMVKYKGIREQGVMVNGQVIAVSQNSSYFSNFFELKVPHCFLGARVKSGQLVNIYFRGNELYTRQTPVLIYPDRVPPVTWFM
jgi:hypothetical protein